MADDFGMGYALGADSGNNNGSGMFNGDGFWGIILLALLFGNNGFGGGFGGGFAGQALTRAELYDGFAIQNIDSAVRGVQNGISDSTYALNNAITGGFNGVNSAICNLGYNIQQGFNTLGYQQKDCCCETQRLIERGFCDTSAAISMQTRDLIDNQNANYRGIMDFLVTEKLASKDARIAELQAQLSQTQQNAFITANQEAQTAELIRRLGRDCPVPAYVVPNPNCCYGNPVGIGYGNQGGCGCGCA